MRRYGAGPCMRVHVRTDVNGDGCVDVADVQAVAAAYAQPIKAPRVAAPPLTAPVAVPRFGVAQPLAGLLPANVTFTVDSAGDDPDANTSDGICRTAAGVCTLRAAIQSANAHSGRDGIAFAIAGSGVHTIALASALPDLSDASGGTEIDGYTQAGASPNTDALASNAVLRIAITGGGDAVSTRPSTSRLPTTRSAASRSTASGARSGSTARTPTTTSSPATGSEPIPPRPTPRRRTSPPRTAA